METKEEGNKTTESAAKKTGRERERERERLAGAGEEMKVLLTRLYNA